MQFHCHSAWSREIFFDGGAYMDAEMLINTMKSIIQLIVQTLAFVFVFSFVFSLLNYLFDWHLGVKGQEVPGDPRAALLFLGIGLVCAGVSFFWGRKKAVSQHQSVG
jgi:drug/metabolite transporter (DMT)-like permease